MRWVTFHSCHLHTAHDALISSSSSSAHLTPPPSLEQHGVQEQALLCRGSASTSAPVIPSAETWSRQTPVPLCELPFYSRAAPTFALCLHLRLPTPFFGVFFLFFWLIAVIAVPLLCRLATSVWQIHAPRVPLLFLPSARWPISLFTPHLIFLSS